MPSYSPKEPLAYLMWYKLNEESRTQYMYVIAVSSKQALYFFIQSVGKVYDYGIAAIYHCEKNHFPGDILGEYAII